MIDAFAEAGGLACTDTTPEGFLFDMGGHVIFSHFQYFDDLIESAVGKGDEFWCAQYTFLAMSSFEFSNH